MEIQADKDGLTALSAILNKLLAHDKVTDEELVPLAIFKQSIKPIPEPDGKEVE
ncbi:hypothetical protein LCGC14_0411250 [marine sediment metagenome]|uniref:Uncharacterized protein n=1 Tax=marine sediment metagenome TaxID=412755 RepID=A0A0F9TBV4_9ZZZZ